MSVATIVRKGITHPYLALIFRLYIAGLFIYAGMYKINYAAEFAETIASYRMVPHWGVNVMAVVMPWVEVICGLLLVCGIRVRSCAVILGGLLAVFTAGIAMNLVWDSPISCGCFHSMGDTISWQTLVRDLGWIALVAHIYLYDAVFHLDRRFEKLAEEL